MPRLGELLPGILGTALGLLVSSLALLALLVGFCLPLGLLKLRPSGGGSRIVGNLNEALGRRSTYLPPRHAARTDRLRTPELLEARTRKTA
jgi:hypothetical protein